MRANHVSPLANQIGLEHFKDNLDTLRTSPEYTSDSAPPSDDSSGGSRECLKLYDDHFKATFEHVYKTIDKRVLDIYSRGTASGASIRYNTFFFFSYLGMFVTSIILPQPKCQST